VGVFPQVDPVLATVCMWAVCAYFALGIALNAISRSKAERNTMVPVAILLTVLSVLIALGYGRMALAV